MSEGVNGHIKLHYRFICGNLLLEVQVLRQIGMEKTSDTGRVYTAVLPRREKILKLGISLKQFY